MVDKDKKQISFSTEVIILWCALGLMFFAACEFFWWQATRFFEVENAGDQSSQLLILTLGAIGAACGLILAARRSAKFSEQVDTGQKQLFNEQLGRGAELLANEGIVMRQTGIRVLGNLAERTINEPEQVKLIMQIIHDFVRSQTKHPSNDEGAEGKGVRDKGDIELSIRTLASLYNKSGRLVELEELVQFLGCHFEKLSFFNAQLQGANFVGAQLQGAIFMGAKLQGANFMGAKLQEARFTGAKLQGADCTLTNFSNVEDLREDQIKGMIFHAEDQPILPKGLEQFLDKRRGYEFKEHPDDKFNRPRFVKSDAEWSGRVVYEWVREYLASILNPKDGG